MSHIITDIKHLFIVKYVAFDFDENPKCGFFVRIVRIFYNEKPMCARYARIDFVQTTEAIMLLMCIDHFISRSANIPE